MNEPTRIPKYVKDKIRQAKQVQEILQIKIHVIRKKYNDHYW
ncbi:ATP binding protein [Vibrio cholerae]|nr:ATP binding protein [Vibrio cholerae]